MSERLLLLSENYKVSIFVFEFIIQFVSPVDDIKPVEATAPGLL